MGREYIAFLTRRWFCDIPCLLVMPGSERVWVINNDITRFMVVMVRVHFPFWMTYRQIIIIVSEFGCHQSVSSLENKPSHGHAWEGRGEFYYTENEWSRRLLFSILLFGNYSEIIRKKMKVFQKLIGLVCAWWRDSIPKSYRFGMISQVLDS